MKLFDVIAAPASPALIQIALLLMRVGIGILTIGHGIPKLLGGVAVWHSLGLVMGYLGIHFLPVMWGFLGACTEFFGGIALVLGLCTRIASASLTFMMFVAYVMHIHQGDSYNVYSFPLSLIFVFISFMITGGGYFSLDSYFASTDK